MAYFANGSMGQAYEEAWCNQCLHQQGCTIWSLHLEHNYTSDKTIRELLNTLIPVDEDGHPGKCSMFYEQVKSQEPERTANDWQMMLTRWQNGEPTPTEEK
jgi:hypothetical protein